ncbi:metallophosphoesterase [Ochrobactrum pecoris]|uniref:Metallophosphoesterase n=1 Tax=Brucella pecoris TaxID=867683 RepID=A0A5C5CCC6_9HYPH|nr:metallophosphoesterase [Brucella pecoris]MBB4096118.1 putative phosphodiesterase [Brucella pecoris]NKW80877.1 metallophosphoesterase [Brucella pecoris]TNV08868.1 metallophosphoesterase [Brucella pecoris]
MKLWIWSDVHNELQDVAYPTREEAPNCDVIMIAGDLTAAPDLPITVEFLIRRYEKPIIYVPGNHEFYQNKWLIGDRDRSLESDRQTIKAIEALSLQWPQRFYCLDADTVIIDNTRFIGASLWVDFLMKLPAKSDLPQQMWMTRQMLNDFHAISMQDGKRFTPEDMLELHRSDAAYIRQKLAEPFDGSTVVLTHHMPHPDCTPPVYVGQEANFLFACGAEAFNDILHSEQAPDIWICGHTHHAFDIQIGQSRIVCNPYGYRWEQGRNGFRWDWVIDTE